jgi:hypothetical protein
MSEENANLTQEESYHIYLEAIEKENYYALRAILDDPTTSSQIIDHAFLNTILLGRVRGSSLGKHPNLSLECIIIGIDNLIKEFNNPKRLLTGEAYPNLLRNPNLSAELIEKYVKEVKNIPKAHLAEAILLNPNCPESIMLKYLADKDPAVRTAIASNKSISLANAIILAKDGHKKVRSAVARNKSIPLEVVETLKDDKAVQVLKTVAKRTKGEVKNTALRNLKLRADVITKNGSKNIGNYEYIARNTDDVEVLEEFVMDSNPDLRRMAVKNPIATKKHKVIEGLMRPPRTSP